MDTNDRKTERSRFRIEWTEREVALLEEHYMTFTAAEIQENFLPERSTSAIYRKALSLKLQKWPLDDTRASWTDEDVATLYEVYLVEGVEGACQRLPHYTRRAIRHKACYLGMRLSTSTRKYWSDEDRQRLIENIHLPLKELRALFPQYAPSSVLQVRQRLRRKNSHEWSQEELDVLKLHYRYLSTLMLQRRFFPMRLLTDIRQRVDELKRHAPPPELNKWSEEECDILHQYYPTLGAGEIQRRYLPHHSRKNIKEKARRIGVLEYGAWTQEELQILKDVYPRGAARAVQAILPHRSRDAIHTRAYLQGLSGSRERPVAAKKGGQGKEGKT